MAPRFLNFISLKFYLSLIFAISANENIKASIAQCTNMPETPPCMDRPPACIFGGNLVSIFGTKLCQYGPTQPSDSFFLQSVPVAMVHQFGPNLNRFVLVRKLVVSRVPMAWWFWRENHDTEHDLRVLWVDGKSSLVWQICEA